MRDAEFARMYEAHARPLLAFLIYRTGDRALAEDLLGDTFERVLRARSFDPRRGAVKSWLYAIALNLLRDHVRRQDTGIRAVATAFAAQPTASGEQAIEELETRDAVLRALNCLTVEEREVVALHYGADLTHREVARLLHVPRTTVEGRFYRALRKLKPELQ